MGCVPTQKGSDWYVLEEKEQYKTEQLIGCSVLYPFFVGRKGL